MKFPLLCLLLFGCASTTVRDRNGIARLSTQADAGRLSFRSSDGDTLQIDALTHSVPTLAGGNAGATIIDSAGRTITGAILAHGAAGTTGSILGAGVSAIPTQKPSITVTPFGARAGRPQGN